MEKIWKDRLTVLTGCIITCWIVLGLDILCGPIRELWKTCDPSYSNISYLKFVEFSWYPDGSWTFSSLTPIGMSFIVELLTLMIFVIIIYWRVR